MKYHFKVHKEGKGYWAECVELEGCRTEADSRAELDRNMAHALNLFLDEPEDSSLVFSLPNARLSGRSVVEVAVEPSIAFAFYLRRIRLVHGLTQSATAKLLGMRNLSSYQRLEASETANPELRTLVRLKRAFPDFRMDDVVG